jgi:hypothetical protein
MKANRLPPDSILTPAAGVLFQEVRDETVLLDLDAEQYYALNESASQIWKWVLDGQPVSCLCEKMKMRYGIEADEVDQSIHELLAELLDMGLVKIGTAVKSE